MAGSASEDSGVGRSLEAISSGPQRCQSGEALAEWRSSEQVENGTPSTSPPYWDTDDDDDCGLKPSELYGKYTWKIDKFSQINKRELRSNAFEVGGYKWYILIYPQGCDVCNHLSLFLCVANHDKLLPGWSHFAQFTIAVVNKDPKKSKYSDTLHRFWKKEHDWGWKKFMELSKVLDGFIDADTLIIKAQVQVIRERADRPFRCLDCQYRRELVRVYLTNVEQICRRFVEDRRGKLGKLIEDKARWSSFCAFWLGIDQNARRRLSRENTESILKVVVKHFFIEKEVTSTLVMDSLYSGLKALDGQTKSKKGRGKYLDVENQSVPIIRLEKDAFVLVDDVLPLLERAAMEPLPPKDEKGPQNRTKDGGSGEDFTKDSIERDERRLTELGRRTIEIFVLAHIFSKIEVAYQEAVALKRQEELIREEEAAWLAESEHKAKRGVADKEKKSKKKQGKQKRNNRKAKDKGKDDKAGVAVEDKTQQDITTDGRNDFLIAEAEPVLGKPDSVEDVSDVSDSLDCIPEILQPDSEDRDSSLLNWDTDTSEFHPPTEASGSGSGIRGFSVVPNGEKNCSSVMDDSSSTCSTDSMPSVIMNGPYKGNSLPKQNSQKSPRRGRDQLGKATHEATGSATDTSSLPSDAGLAKDVSASCKVAESEEAVVHALQDHVKLPQQHVARKEDQVVSLHRKLLAKEEFDVEKSSRVKITGGLSSPRSPPKNLTSAVLLKSDLRISAANDTVLVRKSSLESPQRTDTTMLIYSTESIVPSKPSAHKIATAIAKPTEKPMVQHDPVSPEKSTIQQLPRTTEKPMAQQVLTHTTEKPTTQQVMSRPLSAPLVPGPRTTAPVVSIVPTVPLLSRSVSAAGRLGPDPSPATHSYVPQSYDSYRNAMMGNHVTAISAGFTQSHTPNSAVNASHSYSQSSGLISEPIYLPQSSERIDLNSIRPSLSFGLLNHDMLPNGPQWMDSPQRDSSRSLNCDPSLLNSMQTFDMYKSVQSRSQVHFPIEFLAGSTSVRPNHSVLADEFPHLDIINDLLDDEHGIGKEAKASLGSQSFSNGPHLNRQFTFPGDIGMSVDLGPSTSSCRFERTRSYQDDEFQHNYSSVGGQYDTNMIPQANLQPYPNGQIDGLVPNQWQMAGSNLSYLSISPDNDGFSYHIPEYANLACGVNGYTVFRPSNGH